MGQAAPLWDLAIWRHRAALLSCPTKPPEGSESDGVCLRKAGHGSPFSEGHQHLCPTASQRTVVLALKEGNSAGIVALNLLSYCPDTNSLTPTGSLATVFNSN